MASTATKYEEILPPSWEIHDDAVMARFVGSLPSVEAMESETRSIIQKIPTRSREQLGRQASSSLGEDLGYTLDIRSLYLEDAMRFQTKSMRYFYEIMLSAYLSELRQSDVIDFDIHINSEPMISLDIPETMDAMASEALARLLSEWVRILRTGYFFTHWPVHSRSAIMRRGLLLSFSARFAGHIQEIGHQFLVVLERRVDTPATIDFFVVDNLKEDEYLFPFLTFIHLELTRLIHGDFPGMDIRFRRTSLNRLPTDELMGTCMSVSFRAMVLFSLLQNPFHRLKNGKETRAEATHILRFGYYQMERMRLFFLQGTFGPGRIEPLFFPSLPSPSSHLRRLNTPYFWGVFFRDLRDHLGVQVTPAITEEFIQRIGPDGEDHPFAKRYYFVTNLKYKTVLSTADLSYDRPTCILCQHFPFNQDALCTLVA